MSTPPQPPTTNATLNDPRAPQEHRRPLGWIIASCVLAVAAIGLGVWAFSAQSSADDAQDKLATQEQAANAATPTPTPTPIATATATPAAAATVVTDPATQQQLEQAADDLGATSDTVAQIEQDVSDAASNAEAAKQKADEATGALDTAKAKAASVSANFELTKTCLRGTLDAVKAAFGSGGTEAALQELQKLAGHCASAAG